MSKSNSSADAASVEEVPIKNQVSGQYTSYAMSVIASRALPDVRDGLKPVQRRILYAMSDMGVTSGSAHRKSSSVVGETMGDYHPHGDKSIYDALTNMSQEFSMQVPLVDGQGNFGSLDGDPAAAMRYTESRLAEGGEMLMEDIDKNTTNFSSNYDNRLNEPDVLPAGFPNILVNGVSGIAVGMTTDIPPHNVGEVIDATVHRINNPDCSVEGLQEHMPAPDFPTGAEIIDTDGIEEAYRTGKGSLTLRAKYDVDRDSNEIVIKEIPYMKKKSDLVETIATNIQNGNIDGAVDVRDESDRDGVKIPIKLKQSANIDLVVNKLIETSLETTITMNHIALVDGQPKRLSLPEILDHYIHHRRDVIRRRTQFELKNDKKELEKVNGRLRALDSIDNVISTIRESDDRGSAINELQSQFGFSDVQVENIVRMQLSSLTGLNEDKLKSQKEELETRIEKLNQILNNSDLLDRVVKDELLTVKSSLNHERRTEINTDYTRVSDEDLIPKEENVVVVTEDNYIKRMNIDEFRQQKRNGKGVIAVSTNSSDCAQSVFSVHSHSRLLVVTDKGYVYDMMGYDIPSSSRNAHGVNAINLLGIDTDENIETIIECPDDVNDKALAIAKSDGTVSMTDLREFETVYEPGKIGVVVEDADAIDASIVEQGDDIVMATEKGKLIRFESSEVSVTGRRTKGVIGIDVNDNDNLASIMSVSQNNAQILIVGKNGKAKRTDITEFRRQSRYGLGVNAVADTSKTGKLVLVQTVDESDTVMTFSDVGEKNNILHIPADDISEYSRNANGVAVMDTESVCDATVVKNDK